MRTIHRRVRLWLCGASLLSLAAVCAPAASAADSPWVQRALDSQFELANDIGFANSPWVGTHNSFNSRAEMGPTLPVLDANQQIDLTAQLDAGIRSLELDVHRFPDVPGAPPRVCHARGHNEGHFGCTIEKELTVVLAEIAAWLRAPGHREEVLLLYLEDHLDDESGYRDGAEAVSSRLGELLFAPPPGGCTEVPQDLTREDVLASGAQVVIVSDCGVGAAWPAVAFNWDSHVETRPVGYTDFPDCGPDYTREVYESRFVRYYEDSTALTNQVGPPTGIATPDDGINPATAAAMARCGVDLVGLDQLSGDRDGRLRGLVWSWAPGEPAASPRPARRCAKQAVTEVLPFGRWRDAFCRKALPPACRRPDGSWVVPKRAARQRLARLICGRRGAVLAAPRTGFEAQLLRLAMERRGVPRVRLGLRLRADGSARALDPR